MREAFQAIVAAPVEPNGLNFLPESVRAERIKEGQRYEGVRLHLLAMLGNIRIPVQVDVGFGDAVTPIQGVLPVLLDLPAPRLQLYPREVVVAEKLQAIVALGLLNGWLKDFYDLGYLAEHHAFDGPALAEAIAATFLWCKTTIPMILPVGLPPRLRRGTEQGQDVVGLPCQGRDRAASSVAVPGHRRIAGVPLAGAGSDRPGRFDSTWRSGGPWRPYSSGQELGV